MAAGTLLRWAALAVVLAAVPAAAETAAGVVIDDFDTAGGWEVSTSPGARASLAWETLPTGGAALRLDYDLANPTGYVIVRKAVQLTLPENFAFTFQMRGEAPRCNVEFKVVDRRGQNVWWRRLRDFSFSRDWQAVAVRKSRLAFAWGPAGGGAPSEVGAIELAIAGGEPGSGSFWIDHLVLEAREPPVPDGPPTDVRASSWRQGFEPAMAVDESPVTRWRSEPVADPQWLLLDFGRNREYGGLAVDWDAADYATAFDVLVSGDGLAWNRVYHTETGKGGRDYVYTPDAESRFVRLDLARSSRGRGFGIAGIAVKPVQFSESPNAFFAAISYDAAPGTYPKYFDGKQSYWTVVGVGGDGQEPLVNEEGMVEVDRAFSIEPFLFTRGRLVTWHDAEITQELEDGTLPIPSVVWRHDDLRLRVTAFAAGAPGASTLYVRYRLFNDGSRRQHVRLFVAIRPFQVTPPWQSLNIQGGVTRIHELRFDGRTVWVDRAHAIVPTAPPAGFGAATFEDGSITDYLGYGAPPDHVEVSDPFGFASGALAFDLAVSPRQSATAGVAVPLRQPAGASLPDVDTRGVDALRDEVDGQWTQAHGRVDVGLPREARPLVETLRATLAYMLLNRDGPALRPGPRNYARSWIRDGAMTSEALLQMGFREEVQDFLRWYAGYQAKDGRIPCCVDRRGPDWTPEHDGDGAFVWAVGEYYRFTHDAGFVHELWPNVVRAVQHIGALRAQRTTDTYRQPEQRPFFGLLPESISHEGYSAHPVHSYWDDFFALAGLKDAAWLAVIVGDDDHAGDFAEQRDAFRDSLYASIAATMVRHGIDYLPGSVELGDFDPTSTSIAVVAAGEQQALPQEALRRTYERYWSELEQRLGGTWGGEAYSPYELRNVATFVRLGWRERAHMLLDMMMRDRRPLAWNEWAEVVWRDRSLPRFIGDMPHTWVGAGFVEAVRTMLAYERDADQSLVVGAGLRPEWVASPDGVAVRRLPTHWGVLNYTMRAAGDHAVRVRLSGDLAVPSGKIVIPSPLGRPLAAATVNGRPVDPLDPNEVVVGVCPADVELRYAAGGP